LPQAGHSSLERSKAIGPRSCDSGAEGCLSRLCMDCSLAAAITALCVALTTTPMTSDRAILCFVVQCGCTDTAYETNDGGVLTVILLLD